MKERSRLGMVALACMVEIREDHGSRPAQAESSQDPIWTNGWPGWCTPVMPAMWGSTIRGTIIQVGLGIKQDSISKLSTR
jgi:hypothetical protein